jgi:hypothetical protein
MPTTVHNVTLYPTSHLRHNDNQLVHKDKDKRCSILATPSASSHPVTCYGGTNTWQQPGE